MRVLLVLFSTVVIINAVSFPYDKNVNWFDDAKASVEMLSNLKNINKKAKNVIMFLGDGMGISTVTAARIYKGQLEGKAGEEGHLSFDKFPNAALTKTYTVSNQVADSAATATAFFSGVKAISRTIGVSQYVQHNDCSNMTEANKPTSFIRWAQLAGKATGVVSNTRITHATPAGVYCHTPNREWESAVGDEAITPESCTDIAQQLIEGKTGKDLNVIFGGGRTNFISKNDTDSDGKTKGRRKDGRNLLKLWHDLKSNTGKTYKFIQSRDELLDDNTAKNDYVLGLFRTSHLDYEIDRDGDPSLTEMTEASIKILSKNKNGFALMVEGGRIDHSHHGSSAKRALVETLAFDKAIARTIELTDPEDTLIVVTADHSHGFTIGGMSPTRGNNIFGLVNEYAADYYIPKDNKPMTTLAYANGPKGLMSGEIRANLTEEQTSADDYVFESLVPLDSETHSGEDVAVYAQGPLAHLFRGVMEQNVIPLIMAKAACIGEYKDCTWPDVDTKDNSKEKDMPCDATSNRIDRGFHVILLIQILCVSLWV